MCGHTHSSSPLELLIIVGLLVVFNVKTIYNSSFSSPLVTAIALFEHVNLIYGTISEFCTSTSCPDMTGPGMR